MSEAAELDSRADRGFGEPGAYQLSVGPIHAGVIESGHFTFDVVGERILHLEAELGFKHRGLEAGAVGQSPAGGLAYAQRACGACAVANTVAYAGACEAALGLEPDAELRRARTLLLELERIYNHLNDISAICAGVGFAVGVMTYAALKERAQRLNQRLSGHRFLFRSVALGSNPVHLGPAETAASAVELDEIAAGHDHAWRALQFARTLQDRLDGVGVLSTEDAIRLGAVGPVARASGVAIDARCESPWLAYAGFAPVMAEDASGDVASRFHQRALELEQSFALVEDLLGRPLGPGAAASGRPARASGTGVVESARGRTVCTVVCEGGRLSALRLETASHVNWPVLAHAVVGNLVPDFPLINKSFELCYACSDR